MSDTPSGTALATLRPACDPATALDARFRAAIRAVTGTEAGDPQIRVSGNAKFGDFQVNAAMSLAKDRGTNPRALAEEILKAADLAGIASRCEVAGPGFINVTLEPAFLAAQLDARARQARRVGWQAVEGGAVLARKAAQRRQAPRGLKRGRVQLERRVRREGSRRGASRCRRSSRSCALPRARDAQHHLMRARRIGRRGEIELFARRFEVVADE